MRNVVVEFRGRDNREKTLPFSFKQLKCDRDSVHRLILVCRAAAISSVSQDEVIPAQPAKNQVRVINS